MSDSLALYEMMVRCNVWEQKLLWMIDEGLVSGFFHAGRGQEAIPVGACSVLREDDYLLYAHRGIGYLIAKGLGMEKLFGDFLANTAGTTGGLGAGIVHIAWPELGILGQSGTLGGSFPIATGAGLSAQYRGTDQVVLTFFGDGTSARGTLHESLNASKLWNLPVIWLCENNGVGATVANERMLANQDVADLAGGYKIPAVTVDGQDVEAVQSAVAAAVDRARNGGGPSFIEAKTHRFRGHYEGDPQLWRDREELRRLRSEQDPIVLFADKLTADGRATTDQLASITAAVRAEVDAAAEVALAAPAPSPDRIFQGVYA